MVTHQRTKIRCTSSVELAFVGKPNLRNEQPEYKQKKFKNQSCEQCLSNSN